MTTTIGMTTNATEMKVKNLNPCGCLHGGTCVIIDNYCICQAGYTGVRCGDFVMGFAESEAETSTGGMIAGLVSGGLFILAVIVFIVFIWRRCRTLNKKRQHSQRSRDRIQNKFTIEGYSTTHSYNDKTLFRHNRKEDDFESQDKDTEIMTLEELAGNSSSTNMTQISNKNESQSLEKMTTSPETENVHIINENVKNGTPNHNHDTQIPCHENHNLKLSDADQIEQSIMRKTRRNAVSHRPLKKH